MIESLLYVLYAILIVSSVCSIVFSVKSRRSLDPRVRGLSQAKMNISMGFMLIVLSLIQMFMFSGSTVRVIVGALFMVIGAFNLFAGFRNYGLISRHRAE
ncbi:YtpI family protein [Paenibacillus brevis]|uniref:YtpI family protein n=1 Tax=Paenibacillus brevis TaxID=2841508 RepID=A0ABS6FUL7_9BACL|nr:YtpI family protein [Paenibacillus brevis]MBU5673917.1 YtpI family protein [Paenibacillus brevis]